MKSLATSLTSCTADAIALGRRRVQAWITAGPELKRVRWEELRRLDPQQAIAMLCGPADYHVPPRVARPTSGLVEQQDWFKKAASLE